MCQSHTGRLTGLWFLPKPAFGLNTNDDDDSRESERVTVCQDIADYVNEGARIRAIIIDFFESFDVVPCMKIAASAVDSRVIVWE